MKANLSKDGIITVEPSDSIDEYALTNWVKENKVVCKNVKIKTEISSIVGFKSKSKKNK